MRKPIETVPKNSTTSTINQRLSPTIFYKKPTHIWFSRHKGRHRKQWLERTWKNNTSKYSFDIIKIILSKSVEIN